MTQYVLGGGCFWCLDAVYRQFEGVTQVESGYAGGHTDTPSYYEVTAGTTGHAEVVRVTFDEAAIPPDVVLDIYFLSHDPTTLNRQGADVGTQYRSIMLHETSEQEAVFVAARTRAHDIWEKPIATEIVPLQAFFPAEDEHQDYYSKRPDNPYCQVVIAPKISKARKAFDAYRKKPSQ